MNADELTKFLDALGQRLGPPGQHVWELAVRQQIILGGLSLAVALVLLLGTAAAARAYARREGADDGFQWFIAGVGTVLVVLILWISMPMLLNPEYMAIKDIIYQVTGR